MAAGEERTGLRRPENSRTGSQESMKAFLIVAGSVFRLIVYAHIA
jgi:hypothetical protein